MNETKTKMKKGVKMSEKRNRRDLINEIIEKLQFELDPRARHYIENFSVTMRLRPPETVLAYDKGSDSTCKEVCPNVECMKHTDSDCPKEGCKKYCPNFNCDTLECKVHAHQLSHHSSLGNPDVQKRLKSEMK